MAHGLDKVYPAENAKLAQQIVAEGGCLVSEYAPGIRPLPAYFVERDRIQSAASMGVLVVETDVKGGAMHAVKFAKQYNRLVGCYLHNQSFAKYPQTHGNKKLIEEKIAISLRVPSEIEEFSENMLNLWMAEGA